MKDLENSADRTLGFASAAISNDLPPDVAAVRSVLMEGLTTVEAFASAVDKCKRVVDNWVAQGMPTVRIGRTVYIPVAEARAWLLRPSTRNAPPRKVGRPAGKRAA